MRSKTNGGLGEYAILKIDGYTLLDLRAGVDSADERWRLSVWGRNITDKYYWTNAYRIADVSARFAGMPTTYGATVSFRYRSCRDRSTKIHALRALSRAGEAILDNSESTEMKSALLLLDLQNEMVDPKGKVGAHGLAKIVEDRGVLENAEGLP